jgi:hypothetical protein
LFPILGVPGSARIGTAFTTGPLDLGANGSERGFVIASNRATGEVTLVMFTAAGTTQVPIAGATANPDRVVLSASERSAVLWHSGQLQTEVVTGLPSAPKLNTISLAGLPRDPDLLAVSDEGALLAVFNDATQTHLERFEGGGHTNLIYDRPITAVTFLQRSHDALLADGARLVFLRNAAHGDMRFETAVENLACPAGTQMAVSTDNMRAVLTTAGTNAITAVDLSGKIAPATADCGCSVQQLTPLHGQLVFLLTESANEPSTIVDGSGNQVVISSIPARSGASN